MVGRKRLLGNSLLTFHRGFFHPDSSVIKLSFSEMIVFNEKDIFHIKLRRTEDIGAKPSEHNGPENRNIAILIVTVSANRSLLNIFGIIKKTSSLFMASRIANDSNLIYFM